MSESPTANRQTSWYPWAIGFLVAFGWGISFYIDPPIAKSQVVSTKISEKERAANVRAKVLQQQLAQISQRPVATIDDYIKNTLETGPILDEAKSLLPLQISFINHFEQEHATNTEVSQTSEYAVRLYQKDGEILSFMRDEIYCAKALQALPKAKRAVYYEENVLPLKDKEKQALKEWVAIAKEANAKGVRLPDMVSETTKQVDSK